MGVFRPCRPRTVLFGLKPDARDRLAIPRDAEDLGKRLSARGLRPASREVALGFLRLEVTSGESISAAAEGILPLPEARYAEPDWMGEGGGVVDDTYFDLQWHLSQASGADIEAPAAWDITRGSNSLIVAILDTGIDPDHPEFLGRTLPGYDFVNDDASPLADHPHGVFTSGLLAANADNGFGVAGVNHRSKILPVKVLDQYDRGYVSDLADGLRYAADQGARVISMSLINYPESDALKDELRYAREKGCVLVACSGNLGIGNADVSWPGASPICITVGATTAEDRRASYSGTGMSLDVVAPGSNVITVAVEHSDSYAIFSHCSAATPIAAGIASLLLSADPSLTPEEVQDLLQKGAEDQVGDSDDGPGWDSSYGWGRVNARRSLQLLSMRFLRGDANSDRAVDISDAIHELFFLFLGQPAPLCPDAADADDDESLDLGDPVTILNHLFLAGDLSEPRTACGLDDSPFLLGCSTDCP